jgi:hypothetical protein
LNALPCCEPHRPGPLCVHGGAVRVSRRQVAQVALRAQVAQVSQAAAAFLGQLVAHGSPPWHADPGRAGAGTQRRTGWAPPTAGSFDAAQIAHTTDGRPHRLGGRDARIGARRNGFAPPGILAMEDTVTLNSGTWPVGSATLHCTCSGLHGTQAIVGGQFGSSFTYCDNIVDGQPPAFSRSLVWIPAASLWRRTGTVAPIALDCDEDGSYDDGTAIAHLLVTSPPGAVPGQAQFRIVAHVTKHS